MRRLYLHYRYVTAAMLMLSVFAASCRPVGEGDRLKEWRFAIEEPIGSVQHEYALKFKELIEERTQGEVTVTIYPLGTLGTSDQITEQLQLGAVQFAMASPGHLGKLIPEVQVFLLHFVLSDDERVNHEVLRNPDLLTSLDRLYAPKGMKLLSVYSEGWQVWTTRRPVRWPEDFRGLKMRVMASPLLLAAYEAYGASPTPLDYGEVYSALQLNMIDGQVNPVFAIQEMSFHEVTDWMIFPNHAQFITTAVSGRPFFDSLPPDRQKLVRETVAELHDHVFQVQREFNSERLKLIRRKRPALAMLHLTDDERARFREASLTTRGLFVELAGPQGKRLLDQVLAAVEQAEDMPSDADRSSQ